MARKKLQDIDPLATAKARPLALKRLQLNPAHARNVGRGLYDALPTIPDVIFTCTNLEELEIFRGVLTGPVPKAIGKLTKLRKLELGGFNVGNLPEELGKLAQLEVLTLTYADGITKLPKAIGKLARLTELVVDCSQVTKLPDEICDLTALRFLGLDGTELATLPKAFGKLVNLERLCLPETLEQLPDLSKLTKLRVLEASGKALASLGPALGKLTNLRELRVRQPVAALPDVFGTLVNLERFDASYQGLAAVPPSLAQCKKLVALELAEAQITTALELVLALPKLKELSLADTPIPRDERALILRLMKLPPSKRKTAARSSKA